MSQRSDRVPFLLGLSVYRGLKSATRELLDGFGPQKVPAALVRVGQTELSDYANANRLDRFAPIDVVADLESKLGPVVTRQLAELTGHVLVALPTVAGGDARLMRVTAAALKEVSDVFGKLSEFLADGTLSAVEGAQLDREIDEAIVKLLQLRAQVDALAGRDG